MDQSRKSAERTLFDLEPTQRASISGLLRSQSEIILYPWTDIENRLGAGTATLLASGSLLHPDSARKTISSAPPNGHPPGLAFGLCRTFNYKMSDSILARYGSERPVKARAAINCLFSPKLSSAVNIRAIPLEISDIPPLRQREKGYDLVKVPYFDWPVNGDRQMKIGWILCVPEDGSNSGLIDDSLLPFEPYLDLCIEGAQMAGDSFAEFFLDSTFLADRKTTIREYRNKGP